MNVLDLIRIVYRNRVLLIVTPVLLALCVVLMTKNPTYTYTSETTLYTGIASGGGVKMDENFNYFATNTAFDNLINIIKSRETEQDVALSLLAEHLMLEKADPKYISKQSFDELNAIVPTYIRRMVARNSASSDSLAHPDTTDRFSFGDLTNPTETSLFPSSIDKDDFKQTVRNLKACMESSDTNFVYKLLNFSHPHYSIDAISSINVTRMESSDLVRLRFESDDPGICQQTLAFFMESCISNYKKVKENRSDAVVKYFEYELKKVSEKLKNSENTLLKFNEDHNIINYYEQSKAVAVVKEDLEVKYNDMRIKLAGTEASIKRIEEKLKIQTKIIPKSTELISLRNQLSEINAKIVAAETMDSENKISNKELVQLKVESERLKEDIKKGVNDLYSYGSTTEGLPLQKLLTDWIDNVILYEDTKAGMKVQSERIKDFQKQYAIYAPAGANIKRIEREINVNESEYLEILHGLGLAKLKVQDMELTSSIKAVDPPYFPITANPTKRKMLVVVAAFFGFLFILTIILAMEYFDNSLKNPTRAGKQTKLSGIGAFPRILLKTKLKNYSFLVNRLLELILENLDVYDKATKETKTFLFFSSQPNEGKTILAGNLARYLKNQGKNVVFLNYVLPPDSADTGSHPAKPKIKPYPLVSTLLGYEDTRIDYNSTFLQDPGSYLTPEEYQRYTIGTDFLHAESYKDLLTTQVTGTPDYVFVEIPSILQHPYPVNLMASVDASILVCRANRVWTTADQGILNILEKKNDKKPLVLLNGVQEPVLETILGELPKRRSKFRRFLKNLINLQFFNKEEL